MLTVNLFPEQKPVTKSLTEEIRMTEDTYHYLDGEYMGLCTKCRYAADSCEPDARRYKCESCETKTVYGIQELMVMGLITLVDDHKDETVRY